MGNLPPDERREYQLKRYHERRERFIEQLGGKCSSCSATDDLQFDHIDPATKSFNISSRMMSAPLSELEKELEKCQLLCEECHTKKSAKEQEGRIPWNKGKGGPKNNTHGTYGMAYPTTKCSCGLCEDFREKRKASRRVTDQVRPQTKKLIHGTRAGYQKELRRGLETCDACRKAHREYTNRYR